MPTTTLRSAVYFVLAVAAANVPTLTRADSLPSFMNPISGSQAASPSAVAAANVVQLNTSMFEFYGDAAKLFQANILAKHPVILAMFSGTGGRLTLYRPGQPPLEAPRVPLTYELMKSVGHSTLALTQVVGPYIENPGNTSWIGGMRAYRSRMQSAMDTLPAAEMPDAWRASVRTILANNISFMDSCISAGVVTMPQLQSYARLQAPELKKVIAWAAQTQVGHWMGVIAGWKTLLGSDWDKTYAASNTIYVARQNNVLFSVLAQYFGAEALNDRLLLIETVSFTTTPADLLESVTRIIADRSVGALVFGDYHLMDYELMGGDARQAIVAETAKRGMAAVLPPVVPFGSHQWPMLITPGAGAAALADLP